MRAFILSVLLVIAPPAFAQFAPAPVKAPSANASSAAGCPAPKEGPERGWFWFDDPCAKQEQESQAAQPPAAPKPLPLDPPPPPKEEKCKTKGTWKPDCGFVNPGTDFDFQAKQRDALMERMVVSNNDPKAVEDFQYYMRWALERTAEVTNLWYYNMVQNPDLDPTVAQPVNTLGLRMMTDIRAGKEAEFTRLLKEEGAFLIYFSKYDCQFCHAMAPVIKGLGQTLQIPVHNAALDGKCIEGLLEGCQTAPRTTIPAQALQVSVVPTVFLYVPKNTFIRISTGVTDAATMKARAMQFFHATRAAMLKGVQNASAPNRASVDFGEAEKGEGGATEGVKSTAPRVPSEGEMSRMLNAAH